MEITTEISVIAYLFVLLVVHISFRPVCRILENSIMQGLGSQDDFPEAANVYVQRAERANSNFKETLPIALALLIALPLTGKADPNTATAACTYLIARAAYLPAYIISIPGIRTVIWAIATGALAYMAWVLAS